MAVLGEVSPRSSSTLRVQRPPTSVEDLTPGLLLFFSRPSALQSWAELFGHEWRHVGITVNTDDGLKVASYGPRKCFRLDSPAEIMPAYDRVGVARIFDTDDEVADAEKFCRSFAHLERSDSPYTFSGVLIGPIHLAARRRKPGLLRWLMFLVVRLYCAMQRSRYRDRTAYLCSTFVWGAMMAARSTPLRIPLSAHPDDVAAYATPRTKRDEQFARWLCGPTELWHAVSPLSRAEIDLDRSPAPASGVDVHVVQPPAEQNGDQDVLELRDEVIIDLRDTAPSLIDIPAAS